MHNRLLAAVAPSLLLLSALAGAQQGASEPNRRYLNPVFSETVRTANIEFAREHNPTTAKRETLTLRLFEPADDTAASRPLLLLTPGGGFVESGERWMDSMAEAIARAGYVVALNDYRLSESIETPELYFDALSKAVADQKSALAYLAAGAQGQNPYRLDLDNVFIGGHSAGAITSMHTAYLDSDDAFFAAMVQPLERYASAAALPEAVTVRGVINLSGLLADVGVLDAGEPALLSLHGDRDEIVPIGTGEGIFGSRPLHAYADIIGLDNQLFVIEQGRHNDTADPLLCESCVPLIKRFMFNRLERSASP